MKSSHLLMLLSTLSLTACSESDLIPLLDQHTPTVTITPFTVTTDTTTTRDHSVLIDGACEVVSDTLNNSKNLYAQTCGDVRLDCDPVDGGWMCASYHMNVVVSAPIPAPTPVVVPEPQTQHSTPETVVAMEEIEAAVVVEQILVALETEAEGIPTTAPFDSTMNPSSSWADSYSIGDRCYIWSSFDHNADVQVDTPYGKMYVSQVHDILGGPGIDKAEAIYNDVQCGHGPANNNGDEDWGQCPGRVDLGGDGCGTLGPQWNFE